MLHSFHPECPLYLLSLTLYITSIGGKQLQEDLLWPPEYCELSIRVNFLGHCNAVLDLGKHSGVTVIVKWCNSIWTRTHDPSPSARESARPANRQRAGQCYAQPKSLLLTTAGAGRESSRSRAMNNSNWIWRTGYPAPGWDAEDTDCWVTLRLVCSVYTRMP